MRAKRGKSLNLRDVETLEWAKPNPKKLGGGELSKTR
jgi:hypothetical protein